MTRHPILGQRYKVVNADPIRYIDDSRIREIVPINYRDVYLVVDHGPTNELWNETDFVHHADIGNLSEVKSNG